MIFTIGHSTRTLDQLVALLQAHRVTQLADVRTVPKSRRHPQFARDALERSLPQSGIAYRHFPGLGGLRKPRKDSINSAWRNDSFRGYADYMQTAAFESALDELVAWAGEKLDPMLATTEEQEDAEGRSSSQLISGFPVVKATSASEPPRSLRPTAIMCAEAVWWRCHRQLVADALVARGIPVRHIMSTDAAPPHTLTDFARVDSARRVSYPGLV